MGRSTLGHMTSPAEPASAGNDSASGAERRSADHPPRVHTGSGGPIPSAGLDPDATAPLWQCPRLRIDEAGEFVAAVPALLGFVPRRSLVACLLQEDPARPGSVHLGALARHDLDVPGCGAWRRVAGQLAAICAQERASGVLALIVDDRAAPPRAGRPGARAARHRDLVSLLAGALHAEDIELADAWAVREIVAEGPWWSLLDPACTGVQADPAASPITLAHVLDGRPIRSSREEMTAIVAADPRSRAAVAEVLGEISEAARERYGRAVARSEPDSYARSALALVLRRISDIDDPGGGIGPVEIAEVAVALRDLTVRDAMFALALSDRAPAAEVLWSMVCRSLTGPDRAEAATLLGYSAYVNGDGPFAGVALEAALDADPRHGLAQLLDTALRTGMRPSEIRKLALSGLAKAAELGVELPVDTSRCGP